MSCEKRKGIEKIENGKKSQNTMGGSIKKAQREEYKTVLFMEQLYTS